MKYFSVASVAVVLLLVGTASASNGSSCINITLPNFLGIGRCLGTNGNICSGSQDAGQLISKLFNCTLTGISKFNAGTQLLLLQQLITSILNDIGLGEIARLIYRTCRLAGVFIPFLDCSGLNMGNTTCETPISLSFPSVLGVGRCANSSLPLCEPGKTVTPTAIRGYFAILTCLVQYVFTTDADVLVHQFICDLLNALTHILGPFGRVFANLFERIAEVLGIEGCTA